MMGRSLSLSVLFILGSLYYARSVHLGNAENWDLLIFTQQWPATVCKEWKNHNSSHTCAMPSKTDSWTIHGIWPTKLGTIGPAFCNRTWHFDPEQIKPIEADLMQSWTNIEKETSLYSFWAHEWNKHGTCAAVLNPLNAEMKYFSKGLEWLQKYTMSDILSEANIVPSDSREYAVKDIFGAIHSKLGTNAAIECRKEDGKSWLVEIRICFDKNLMLTNCDGILSYESKLLDEFDGSLAAPTNCDLSQGVIYPHSNEPPNGIYVQLYNLVSWLQWFTL